MYCEIIDYFNLFSVEIQLKNQNMKSVIWTPELGCPNRYTDLPNSLHTSLASVSKKMYFDKLDDICNKHNNTYHRTIKMKPVDVKLSIYTDSNKESNTKSPKFKAFDHARISKYKNIFAKGYVTNWSEEVFVIKKVKNTALWIYVISDLNGDEIV